MIKTTVIGNLANDVVLRTRETSDTPFAILRIASDRRYRDKEGNRRTDFVSVKVWGKVAELCEKYAYKGCKLAVSGDLETIIPEGEERANGFLVKADNVEFLSPPRKDDVSMEGC